MVHFLRLDGQQCSQACSIDGFESLRMTCVALLVVPRPGRQLSMRLMRSVLAPAPIERCGACTCHCRWHKRTGL